MIGTTPLARISEALDTVAVCGACPECAALARAVEGDVLDVARLVAVTVGAVVRAEHRARLAASETTQDYLSAAEWRAIVDAVAPWRAGDAD